MTPISREAIVEEARRWIGTPFVHQGRVRGLAVDCIGLVIETGRACGVTAAMGDPAWDFREYGPMPNAGRLLSVTESLLSRVPVPEAAPGDVLLFRLAGDPQHFGIFAGETVIHAYQRFGCVEHRLADVWRARIMRAYRFPGVM